MDLDLRTMMIMSAELSFMLAVLLALAGLHIGKIRGVGLWAIANLCFSLGLIMALFKTTAGHSWLLVVGAAALAAGFGLQYLGIRAFREKSINWRVPILLTVLVSSQTTWFSIISPDIISRVVCNSLCFALISAACARELLVPVSGRLSIAYRLTGFAFAALALVFLARIAIIPTVSGEDYTLYSRITINPTTFLFFEIVQLCLSFGFVLMIHYRLADELHNIAAHDSLTGALTRRSLAQEAERLAARSRRSQQPLAFMMIDVDHFKKINDEFGHVAGDDVLCQLADIVRASIRGDDYFARFGGEEFCILLPDTTEAEAMIIAERLRRNYAHTPLRTDGATLVSSISIGVADSTHTATELSALVAAADSAMYRAKHLGRNRVIAHSTLASLDAAETTDFTSSAPAPQA